MRRTYDKDPYGILGIAPGASAREVKQAYLRLARENHPDVNNDPGAMERMKEINWAYALLSNPRERAFYDRWGTSGTRVVFYSGTKTPRPDAAPENRSSSSSSTHSARPNTYPNSRAAQDIPAQGRSTISIWLVIITLVTLMRALLQTAPPLRAPIISAATRTALVDSMTAAMGTMQAVPGAANANGANFTPPPASTAVMDAAREGDWQEVFVPGSWEWEQLHRYFPHLTTPDGLSDEVTRITYDPLQGYQIKTRGSGDYWLFIDRYDQTIMPAHFPPSRPPDP